MQTFMKNNSILFLLTCLLNVSAFGNDLTIRNFRFARHNALDFERLVIEFKASEAGAKPGVKINLGEREAQIQLRGAQLVGGIPETAINESYKGSSKYFGPLSINTDSPDGNVLLRAFTKKSNSKVDAFWLNDPPRLIVDVFPEDSERSFGREVVGNREFASTSSHKKSHGSSHEEAPSVSRGNSAVVCYPANAQVKPTIGFDRRAKVAGMVVSAADLSKSIGNDILCFTSASSVVPTISFQPNEPTSVSGLFQGNFDEKPRVFVPSNEPVKKQAIVEKPMGAPQEQQGEEDMLGLGDGEMRSPTTASQYDDSFNKNNPPPTLGKTLLPPIESSGAGGKGGSGQGANPATLLPPLH